MEKEIKNLEENIAVSICDITGADNGEFIEFDGRNQAIKDCIIEAKKFAIEHTIARLKKMQPKNIVEQFNKLPENLSEAVSVVEAVEFGMIKQKHQEYLIYQRQIDELETELKDLK